MCTIGGSANTPEIIKLFPRFCPNIRCDVYGDRGAYFLWTQNVFTFITTKVVVSSLDLSGQPFGRALLIHLFGNRKSNVAWILLQYSALCTHQSCTAHDDMYTQNIHATAAAPCPPFTMPSEWSGGIDTSAASTITFLRLLAGYYRSRNSFQATDGRNK